MRFSGHQFWDHQASPGKLQSMAIAVLPDQ
jgi:hypothetical protein